MGLSDEEQQDLHDNHWIKIERKLGVELTTEPVDIFLRDFLRWRTGRNLGISRVHEEFRRWAVREGKDQDRAALCCELAQLAGLYGILTATSGGHSNPKAERALRHLRALGIHAHRPLTLRLLHDAERGIADDDALTVTLVAVETWITRLWLANRPTAGLNTAATELSHRMLDAIDADYAGRWLGRIRALRSTRVGVPGDEEVRAGVSARKAYGGSASRSSFAILCALMEAEHGSESPKRDNLTVEHIMPRKLTAIWKRDLGDDAEDVHELYCHRIANLTLSGDTNNSAMGTDPFLEKRRVYEASTIGMTRRVAAEGAWNQETLDRRARDLASRSLKRWPWEDERARPAATRAPALKWRIGNGAWHPETVAKQMVLDVAGALLGMDPGNAAKLSGNAISSNIHPATRCRPGARVGSKVMHAVSGHPEWVMSPYKRNWQAHAAFCRRLGDRCGVSVEVKVNTTNPAHAFWEFLRERTGGFSGQTTAWHSATQRTATVNAFGDRIRVHAGKEKLRLDFVVRESAEVGLARSQRVLQFSRKIHDCLGDQEIEDPSHREPDCSTGVVLYWTRDDTNQWADAARWMWDQYERLRAVARDGDNSQLAGS